MEKASRDSKEVGAEFCLVKAFDSEHLLGMVANVMSVELAKTVCG